MAIKFFLTGLVAFILLFVVYKVCRRQIDEAHKNFTKNPEGGAPTAYIVYILSVYSSLLTMFISSIFWIWQ